MHLIIDGSKIASDEDLHTAIAEGVDLPNWYLISNVPQPHPESR
jgi:hypothetical protein